jgi:hypothetical protein
VEEEEEEERRSRISAALLSQAPALKDRFLLSSKRDTPLPSRDEKATHTHRLALVN